MEGLHCGDLNDVHTLEYWWQLHFGGEHKTIVGQLADILHGINGLVISTLSTNQTLAREFRADAVNLLLKLASAASTQDPVPVVKQTAIAASTQDPVPGSPQAMDEDHRCGNELHFLQWWLQHHGPHPRKQDEDTINEITNILRSATDLLLSPQITNQMAAREVKVAAARSLTEAVTKLSERDKARTIAA